MGNTLFLKDVLTMTTPSSHAEGPALVQAHLSALARAKHSPQGPVRAAPQAWAAFVAPDFVPAQTFSARPLCRDDVVEFCRDPGNSVDACFLVCMAWGGLHRGHGVRAWRARENWREVLETLRSSREGRAEAYDRLALLRPSRLPGLRPAFFTKLLFFLRPAYLDPGYIMDQWTAKSVNLLTGTETVLLNQSGFVTDANDGVRYERFCHTIEDIARAVGVSGAEAEERLFSQGRGRGAWRRYVAETWARRSHLAWQAGDVEFHPRPDGSIPGVAERLADPDQS